MLCRLAILGVVLVAAACTSDREQLPAAGVSVDGQRIAAYDYCHDDPRLDIEEGPTEVEIQFTVREASGGDCFSCTFGTLDEPLGERAVIDSTTGLEVSTSGDCFSPP